MADRPNLLVILCDQFRHDWLGYAGADHVATPNLDRLAARGRVFTQCTTNSPVCAPARIGLATGLRPHRMGALNNHAFLPLSRPTYYQRLRDHGYHVGCVGKLDLAKPDGFNGTGGNRPWTYGWGFTHPLECEGKMHAGRGNPPNGPYTAWLREQGLLEAFTEDYSERSGQWSVGVLRPSVVPTEAFEDVFIARKACEMMQGFSDEFPWHLFVSFVGPHNPFDPPEEYAARYADADMPDALPVNPDVRPHRYPVWPDYRDAEKVRAARRLYSGYVTLLDDQVGRLLETLERTGQAENTHVCFAADHGEMLGDHARFTKSVHYEASLRVPLVVAGPGIAPGRSDALVELSDVNPTLCDLAGVGPIPRTDARSLLPLLRGETAEHREEAVATLLADYCLRTREWKLIAGNEGVPELYHLADDPDEQVDLAADRVEVVADLGRRMWARLLEGQALR